MKYIYTVITGGKDKLDETINGNGAKLVCFTDEDITSEVWEIRKLSQIFADPRRESRIAKMLPHIMFPDATYSLYIDGNISIKVPIQRLIDEWLVETDVAMFKHSTRDCLFDEAKECIRLGLDEKNVIEGHTERYKGFPEHAGLCAGGVILRKHTPKIARFNEAWFAEYCTGCKRDQISMPVAIHKAGVPVKTIPGHPFYHEYFEMTAHEKPSEWAGKL